MKEQVSRRSFLQHLPEITLGLAALAGAVQVEENTTLATDVTLLKARQSATEMAVQGNNNLAFKVNQIGGEVVALRHDINTLAQGENILFDRTKK